MSYAGIFIKLILFFLSNIGYWELLRRKTRIDLYFFPSMTIAVQITLLYFAGLLNCLYESSILLYGFGIVLLLYYTICDRSLNWFKCYQKIGFFYLIFVMAVLLFYVKGRMFTHYDNFSHWALVVKQMLAENRYPNFKDTLIVFQEYPLGSAAYVYYMAVTVGKNESIQMFAQIYMMLTCLVPAFIKCKKNKWFCFIFMVFATNFILIYNVLVTDLLVDTLLPLVSANALFYLSIYGKGDKQSTKDTTALYLAMPFLIQILQIKNSGIFFVGIASIWILAGIKKDRQVKPRIIVGCLPYLTMWLWHKHCEYVFADSLGSKHAMTVGNYKSVFGDKTAEEIRNICTAMLRFSLTWKELWIVCGCVIVLGIVSYLVFKDGKKGVWKLFASSLVLYVTYQIGMTLMYIFSMSSEEAASLAGSVRYEKTILLVIFYGVLLVAMHFLSEMEAQRASHMAAASAICLAVAACHIGTMGPIKMVVSYTTDSTLRDCMEKAKREYQIPEHEAYCIFVKEEKRGYAYYMAKYVFGSDQIAICSQETAGGLDTLGDIKYVVVADPESPAIQEWISIHYPDQAGNDVIIRE